MEDGKMFWDRKITKDKARKVLRDEFHPRFVEYAALFLSRTNEPKIVFDQYVDKKAFCRQWRKIKKQMRINKWNDNKIVFWDEVYRVISSHIDKGELRILKEKRPTAGSDIIKIGKKIREARKARGWTQGELSKKCGFSQQTISFVESGYINISFLTLKKILNVLELEILITGKEKPTYTTFTENS